jgi:1-acyl-sn-glycerol-3-phosphate acyltransferase
MSGVAWKVLGVLGMRVDVEGQIPRSGLIIANHLTYLDIVALNAVTRCLFVSKAEIAKWPLFGQCARWAGVVFIDRKKRSEVAEVAVAMRALLEKGVPLVLFPEGTTSSGDEILPFKPSLFAAVLESGSAVTPCAIEYFLDDEGCVRDDVHYWGEAHLGSHLFRLLGKRGLSVRLSFGESFVPSGDRKDLAQQLHSQVRALRRGVHAVSALH